MLGTYESQLLALIFDDVYPKKMENNLPIPQEFDLKNLNDYEESNYPRWSQFSDEDQEELSSSQAKKKQQGPPGFSTLHSIQEENSFLNHGVDYPNMFFQNGPNNVNPAANDVNSDVKKIQLEILKLQVKISIIMGRPMFGADSVICLNLLQEEMNTLMNKLQEITLSEAKEINLKTPQMQNFAVFESQKSGDMKMNSEIPPSPSINNSSPSTNISETNNFESSPTNFTESSSNLYESAESKSEKINENQNFWDTQENITGGSRRSPVGNTFSTNFSNNMEEFFKQIPKLSMSPEIAKEPVVKETNPFKADLARNKHERVNLKTFYDTSPPDLKCNDPKKTENFKFPNIRSEMSSDTFVFGKGKVKTPSNLENQQEPSLRKPNTPPSHNFAPVIDPCSEKVNLQGSKVIYEAGPVLYNKQETENKTKNDIYQNTDFWKPVPPAEINRTRETVKMNAASFNIGKPKSATERMKKQINKNISGTKLDGRNSNFNPTTDSHNPILSPNSSFATNFPKLHILSPGELPRKNDVSFESVKENCHPTESRSPSQRSPSVDIFTSVTKERTFNADDNSPIVLDDFNSSFKSFNLHSKEEIKENGIPGYKQNTNPFIDDITLTDLQTKTGHDLNEVFKTSESFKFFEHVTESSKIDLSIEFSSSQDDPAVCFMYQLNSKDRSVIVINISDEGWLITEEFVEAFTDFDASSVMLALLNMMNLEFPFKVVDRASHPELLAELDLTPLNVVRDSHNKILRSVHLTPLKSTLKILTRLKIVKVEDVNVASTTKSSNVGVISDMIKLISSYGTFMRTKCKN